MVILAFLFVLLNILNVDLLTKHFWSDSIINKEIHIHYIPTITSIMFYI